MEADRIIYKGDTAKYKVTITHEDFDMQVDDFFVILRAGIPYHTIEVNKEDMLHDEDGDFYILVPTSDMVGRLEAECHYMVPDSDISGGTREEVDYQWLAFVSSTPCPRFACRHICWGSCEDSHVQYERIWRSDAKTLYLNVRTADKENVKGADGNQIRVRKEEKDIY